jgi:hypothetical protein
VIPFPVPPGRTARRVEWAHLPPGVRRAVEERCGSPVATATSQNAGFTPGFASVLVCADGSRHFVKAASTRAQRPFAQAYREEVRKLQALPDAAPAPRLRWHLEAEDWFVLATEHVEARAPRRPWRPAELQRCLDALAAAVPVLTPPPPGLALPPATEEFAGWPELWDEVRTLDLGLRGLAEHLDEAAALARRHPEATAGSTVVHGDVRDDNLLLAGDGRVLLCDWNFPFAGADWLDALFLLIGPRGDGLDVEAAIAASPLLAAADPQHVDVVLALATGYFLRMSAQPVPATSPFLREVQRWQGEVCWDWLAERRGWR